jgi:competence protein ComEC
MLSGARQDGFSNLDLRSRLSRNEIPFDIFVPFEGCAADDSQKGDGELLNTIDLRALRLRDSWSPTRGCTLLRIPESPDGISDPATVVLRQGDRVRGWAAWHVPRNFQNPGSSDHAGFLARRGIYLLGRVKSARLLEVVPGDCQDSWNRVVSAIRRRAQGMIGKLAQDGGNDQAAILAAVVLGDYSGLSATVREAFQNSGTYHVLVVSGLHVSWIAWVLVGLFHLLRIPRGTGRVLAVFVILLYSSVVGFQASISRALWMFLLYLLGKVFFRRAAPANIALSSAFLLLVLRPDWVLDAGFQLSFLSVLAICLMGAPVIAQVVTPVFRPSTHAGDPERLFLAAGTWHRMGRKLRFICELWAESSGDVGHPRLEAALLAGTRSAARALSALASMIAVSVSVQLWLEPLLAYHFNRLSWIAPVANLAVVPLSSAVLAVGLLSALASNLPGLGPLLLSGAGWLASTLLKTASGISSAPFAWQRCPTPTPSWVVAGIVVIAAWCFRGWKHRWIPAVFIGSVLACLSAGMVPASEWLRLVTGRRADPASEGLDRTAMFRLTFLDVGEGDSIVIRFPDARTWVLDAGGVRQSRSRIESERSFDIGEAVVSRYLWQFWITRLDRLVLSHPDMDHAGGSVALLRNFRSNELVLGDPAMEPLLEHIVETARGRGVPVRHFHAGKVEFVAGVTVQTLNPPDDGIVRSTNEGSVVLRLSYGRFTCLLTGDLEKAGESLVAARLLDMPCLLLKVAHHGSRWSTMDPLLERTQARWGVISVGKNNPFGHPSREVLLRLSRHRVRTAQTSEQGAITFATDGSRYCLSAFVGGILESGPLP